MKYAIFGDIHGNQEALEACVAVMAAEKVDRYICLGDIIGYGSNPLECLKIVEALNPMIIVAGNHDFAVIGRTTSDYFNPFAKNAVEWTRSQLTQEYIDKIGSWKLTDKFDGATVVHSTLDEPEKWGYILTSQDAICTFRLLENNICFIGHSHIPIILEQNVTILPIQQTSYKLKNNCKYIINAGSVGQPRDGNPRSCFVIYDSDTHSIQYKRVSYDIEKAQMKIINAGLPEILAERLGYGK